MAACSRRLQGYEHVPFHLCEHCTYVLTPASGLPLLPQVMHNLAPAFQVNTQGWTLLSGDTRQGTQLPQQSTLGASEPRSCSTASPAALSSAARLGQPSRRAAIPAAGQAPAQMPLQHHLLLILLPPTVAWEEKGSAEGGGRRAASRGRAFFGEQRQPLSAAAARPASPDCTSVCCGASAQSPSLLGEHRAISRVTSLLRGGRTGGSPLLPCCGDAKPSPPSAV